MDNNIIKPNWDNFKAKFSEDKQGNFEWFCYLLFCKEHNRPKGIFRYKNQSAIETEPIQVENKLIGWQAKFYKVPLSQKNKEIIETIKKAKRDYPNITDLIFYMNQEWGQGRGGKAPTGKTDAETQAKELYINIEWRTASFFESEFVSITNKDIAKYFFTLTHKNMISSKADILIPIAFKNLNTQYTTPLTCSGLSEKDIQICPANKIYIENVQKNLELGHKCIIKGKSGTGKTLLTYQVAKIFYDDGWKVYKITKSDLINNTITLPDEKLLLLVDDAQTLSTDQFGKILEKAHEACLVLLNWNIDSSDNIEFLHSYPYVDIIPSEQVEMIEEYSLEHKDEIIQVLEKMDITINQKDSWDNIERRIQKASTESTPWLFNYNLTEGWRKAEEDVKFLSDNEHLDLTMIVVALYQIGTLDKGVSKETILDELKHYNSENNWLDKASKVIDEYCLKDGNIIRHKHYLYAKKVLSHSQGIDTKDKKHQYIVNFIKRLLSSIKYEYGHSSLLEYIMFDDKYTFHELKKDNFILDRTTFTLQKSLSNNEIRIKNLDSLIRFDNRAISIVEDNIKVIHNWILTVNKHTVWQLQKLINTLDNEKVDLNINDEMFRYVLSKTVESDIVESAKFSSLYNRLHLFSSAEQKERCFKNIEKTSFSFNISNVNMEIDAYHFSEIINNLGNINNNWARQCLLDNINYIADAFNTDILQAYSLYRDLIGRYFGVIFSIVSNKKINNNKRFAKKFIKLIKTESILKTFKSLTRFNMQDFCTFLIFISMNDEKRIDDILSQVDFNFLKEIYKDDTDLEHWHKGILRILYNTSYKPYQEYIAYLMSLTGSKSLVFRRRMIYSQNAKL